MWLTEINIKYKNANMLKDTKNEKVYTMHTGIKRKQ